MKPMVMVLRGVDCEVTCRGVGDNKFQYYVEWFLSDIFGSPLHFLWFF